MTKTKYVLTKTIPNADHYDIVLCLEGLRGGTTYANFSLEEVKALIAKQQEATK